MPGCLLLAMPDGPSSGVPVQAQWRDLDGALATLAQRTMQLQVTVQDGAAWIGDGQRTVEITPLRLYGHA